MWVGGLHNKIIAVTLPDQEYALLAFTVTSQRCTASPFSELHIRAMVWFVMVRHDIWYGMVLYGMIWYSVVNGRLVGWIWWGLLASRNSSHSDFGPSGQAVVDGVIR